MERSQVKADRVSIARRIWRFAYRFADALTKKLRLPDAGKKRAILDRYRERYAIRTLVETGTFLGDTVEYFRPTMQRIFSIELSEALHAAAVKRFAHTPHVTLIHGDSGAVLEKLVPELSERTLFWLDGHYSSEFFVGEQYVKTAKGELNTPILRELNVLLRSPLRHVILIDDARLFSGQGDYPTMAKIRELVESNGGFRIKVRSDIIRITPVK